MTSPGMGGDIEKANSCHGVWWSLRSRIPRKMDYLFLETKGSLCIPSVSITKKKQGQTKQGPYETQRFGWAVMSKPQASFPSPILLLLPRHPQKAFTKSKHNSIIIV